MTSIEYNTLLACELDEIACAAYEAGDFTNWRRMAALAACRWAAVRS